MAEIVFLEVLERGGEVKTRHGIERFPITVGRAYDNDIILDDPYVAPHHLRIERTESGELIAVDLESRNGLYCMGPTRRVARAALAPDLRIRVGHTILRLRPQNYTVPAEVVDTHGDVLRRPLTFVAALALMIVVQLMHGYSEIYEETEAFKLALPVIAMLFLITIWAGTWSFASKLIVKHAQLPAHTTIALLGLVVSSGVEVFCDYAAFAFSSGIFDFLKTLSYVVVLAAMIYFHLKLISRRTPRRLAFTAASVSLCLMAAVQIFYYSRHFDDLDRGKMTHLTYLKPPGFRVVSGVSPETFFSSVDKLKTHLDRQIDGNK